MENNLKYTFEVPEGINFNFMLDNGTIGHSGISVLSERQYQFTFDNSYSVIAKYNNESKSIMLYSNVEITDTGTNPNGIRILGLGDPDFFRTHLNL